MSEPRYTDVLVVGAGPVGLLTALGLAQHNLDTLIIGKLIVRPYTDIVVDKLKQTNVNVMYRRCLVARQPYTHDLLSYSNKLVSQKRFARQDSLAVWLSITGMENGSTTGVGGACLSRGTKVSMTMP